MVTNECALNSMSSRVILTESETSGVREAAGKSLFPLAPAIADGLRAICCVFCEPEACCEVTVSRTLLAALLKCWSSFTVKRIILDSLAARQGPLVAVEGARPVREVRQLAFRNSNHLVTVMSFLHAFHCTCVITVAVRNLSNAAWLILLLSLPVS